MILCENVLLVIAWPLIDWNKTAVSQPHVDPPETEAGPRVGPSGRFAALPLHERRALVVCAAWLICAYGGVALVAAGIDRLLGTAHPMLGLLLIAIGATLAVTGFVRCRKRVASVSEWSV